MTQQGDAEVEMAPLKAPPVVAPTLTLRGRKSRNRDSASEHESGRQGWET